MPNMGRKNIKQVYKPDNVVVKGGGGVTDTNQIEKIQQ